MEKKIHEQIVDTIIKYLEDRINVSSELRKNRRKFNPITIKESSINNLYEYQNIILSEEELEILLSYIKKYLLSIELKNFPDTQNDHDFIEKILEKLKEDNSRINDNTLDILHNYIKNMSAHLILDEIMGKISQELLDIHPEDLFSYIDYNNKSFIVCSKKFQETKINPFLPVFLHNKIYVAILENNNDKTTLPAEFITETQDAYYEISHERYFSKKDYSIKKKISLETLCQKNNFYETKKDVYNLTEIKNFISALIKWSKLSESEKTELNKEVITIVKWWSQIIFTQNVDFYDTQKQILIPLNLRLKFIEKLKEKLIIKILTQKSVEMHCDITGSHNRLTEELKQALSESNISLDYMPTIYTMEISLNNQVKGANETSNNCMLKAKLTETSKTTINKKLITNYLDMTPKTNIKKQVQKRENVPILKKN